MSEKETIAVIGLWHLGEVYAGCLADLGHKVIGWDKDDHVVANLNAGILPLPEYGLQEKIMDNLRNHRLSFTSEISNIKDCDIIWLTFDTPVNEQDEVDLQPIWDFLNDAVEFFKDGLLVVISSQMPVGTTEAINMFIKKTRPHLHFDIAYVPENLQLGKAVESFTKPGRIVIGSSSEVATKKIKDIFSSLTGSFLTMDTASAEMSKHALNAFLATSLSFTYDIADLCQLYGADISAVAKALRSDGRIGQGAYLDVSLGFSGGTLARDLKILLDKARIAGIKLPVISAVWEKNNSRRGVVLSYLEKQLGSLQGGKITIFGLTYKPGTSTLRRALSLEVIDLLQKRGAFIRVHDPVIKKLNGEIPASVQLFVDPYEAARGSQAIIFITSWPDFKNIDFKALKTNMVPPYFFFDTRNFFIDQENEIKGHGFTYRGLGR